tara:strand:- start:87 stop:530 length:444 start_codon:yes stop_codon:yes gene_type:complete
MAQYIQVGAYDTPSVSKTGATASLPKVAGFVLERYRQAGDLVSLQRSKRTPKDLGIPPFSMQAASAGSGRSSLSTVNVGKFSDADSFGTKPLISQDAATSLVDKFVNRPQTLDATPQGTRDFFNVSTPSFSAAPASSFTPSTSPLES